MTWFDGFQAGLHAAGEVELFARTGGDPAKPALLLLHGYPQTHAIWHRVAQRLAADFSLVIPDLRGYGDSSKPIAAAGSDPTHALYSKRAMAADMAALMNGLGHRRFLVAGHDRVTLGTEDAARFLSGLRRRGDWADAAEVAVFGIEPAAFLGSAHIVANELIPGRLLNPIEIQQILLNAPVPHFFCETTS